jgi:cytochrome d ubiquinol oxidase subunit II
MAIGAVSLATPFLQAAYYERWFAWPQIALTAPVPALVAIAAVSLFLALRAGREVAPFLLSLALFALTFAGLGISLFPFIVPETITIWDAAAPDSSLIFMLVGAGVMIPIILAYTGYAYWVFRGKVRDDGYH